MTTTRHSVSPPCTCGHAIEEHGHDPMYPGSSACSIGDCTCIAYEAEENEHTEKFIKLATPAERPPQAKKFPRKVIPTRRKRT